LKPVTKWTPWTFLILWLGLCFVSAIMLGVLSQEVPSFHDWMYGKLGFLVLTVSIFAVAILLILALSRPKTGTELLEVFSVRLPLMKARLRWLCLGAGIAAVTILVPNSAWGDRGQIMGKIMSHTGRDLGYFLFAMVIGSMLEEAILRGYLYRVFSQSYGRMFGLFIVGGITAALHTGSPFSVLFFGGFGVLTCYILDSRQNVIDCIAFHIAYNSMLAVLTISGLK